jgi:hypothetical protein
MFQNWDPIVIDSELDTDCDYTGGVNYCLESDEGSNEGYSDDWTDSNDESLIEFDMRTLICWWQRWKVLQCHCHIINFWRGRLLNNGSKLNRIEHWGIPEGL